MTEILHMVRNVTLFLVMGNILSNLFNGSHYRKYFTFITGVIVVVMVVAPILTVFHDSNILDDYLQKSILSIEKSEMETEIEMAGKTMEDRVLTEYGEEVAKMVLAEFELTEEDARVEVNIYKEGERKGMIKSIILHTDQVPKNLGHRLNNLSIKLGISGDKIMIDRGDYGE